MPGLYNKNGYFENMTHTERKNLESLNNAWFNLCPQERLETACAFFKCLTQEPPGSFRRLIYERLGFSHENYSDLYTAGGMTITNALSTYHDEIYGKKDNPDLQLPSLLESSGAFGAGDFSNDGLQDKDTD